MTYHDMAMDVMRQAERDGIRTMSGHHMHVHITDGMCDECYGVERHAPKCPYRAEGEDGEGDRDWKLDR